MDSPFKTPKDSGEFFKQADDIAKKDLRIKDNQYGKHEAVRLKVPAGLTERTTKENFVCRQRRGN